MRRALLLAALLSLTTALPFASQALPACGAVPEGTLEPLAGLAGLPEGWHAYRSLDASRLPPIPTIVATSSSGLSCDLTANLGEFVAHAGVRDPAQLASLVVATSYPDQLGVPVPTQVSVDGGVARVTAASPEKGALSEWTVDLASLRGDFVVTQVGAALGATDFEGWHPWVGFSSQYLRDLENGALVTKTLLAPNADGSQFRFTYFTQFYASEAQADQYANDYAAAAQAIWTIQVAQWGFVSADPDGTYDIKMDGCSCISGGNNVNIRVHAKLEDLWNFFTPPLVYPGGKQGFYRIVIGHEFHHHLQYSINQWQGGGAMVEGGARFSETVFDPASTYGPNTLTSVNNINGFSNVMSQPWRDLSSRLYDFGLFWGYLHGADGGIQTLKKVYQAAGGSDGNTAIPAAVTTALSQTPGAKHRTFEEAYAGLAVAMAKRDVTWGLADNSSPRNWATILAPLTKSSFSDVGPLLSQAQGTVPARTLAFVALTKATPEVASFIGDSTVSASWVAKTPAGFDVQPAGPATVLDTPGQGEVVLAMASGGGTAGPDAGRQVAGPFGYRANIVHP